MQNTLTPIDLPTTQAKADALLAEWKRKNPELALQLSYGGNKTRQELATFEGKENANG